MREPRLLLRVRRRRHLIAFSFAALTSTAFFVYLCMLKLRPDVMTRTVSAGSHFSWAIVASIAMIGLVITISGSYVFVTRRWLDPLIRQLRRSDGEG